MILILTKDLMMSSSAGAAARAKGLALESIPSVTKLESRLSDQPSVKLLLIDLQMPGLNFEQLSSVVQALDQEGGPTTIAYAQHVNVDLIEQAKAAAFDQVLTRGQLNASLEQLMAQYGAA